LDWGVFGPEDNDLTFEDCVTKILPRMTRKVLESSGAESLSVLGYCMGAPLSASFLAAYPETPVRNFINMAGPIDFSKIGLFGLWVGDFYQQNKLFKGEAVFGGRPARLSSISCPVFVVGAKEDYIAPPESVRALIDAVSSRDKDYVELPGGHISLIAGRGASL